MKIYFIYIKIPSDCYNKETGDATKYSGIPSYDKYYEVNDKYLFLYAISDNKEYVDDFFKIRNKDLFYKKIVDIEELPEYPKLIEKLSDQGEYWLNIEKLTSKKIVNGFYKKIQIPIVVTENEYDSINDSKEDILYEMLSNTELDLNTAMIVDNCLNKKIKYSLDNILMYQDIIPQMYPIDDSYPEDDDLDNINFDEFSIFLILFGNTLKIERILN